MKKNMVVGIAMAVGILSFSALSASAAGSDPSMDTCASKSAYQLFIQETSELTNELKNKEFELREQYSLSDYVDKYKEGELEAAQKELKSKINAVAQKYGIPACSRS